MLDAVLQVTWVASWPSFFGISYSRRSFFNPDSTPPQMSNATAHDGDPCAGRHSQTFQDFIPSYPGLFEKPSPPPSPSRFAFFWEPVPSFISTQLKYESIIVRILHMFRLFSMWSKNKKARGRVPSKSQCSIFCLLGPTSQKFSFFFYYFLQVNKKYCTGSYLARGLEPFCFCST